MLCLRSMHFRSCLSGAGLGLAVTCLLAAPHVHAQGEATEAPDALEQPYGPESKPPTPAATPAAEPTSPPAGTAHVEQVSVVVEEPPPPVDTRPKGPIRERRRLALSFETGWNGLSGFGLMVSYHIVPHFTVDLGTGLSLTGLKGGLRGRYNLLTGPVTPFVGAGILGSTGLGKVSGDFGDKPNDDPTDDVTIRVRPTVALQTVLGIDWTSEGGFTLLAAGGYAFVLNDNLDIIAGSPTKDERNTMDIIFGSGPVVAASVGYTFR